MKKPILLKIPKTIKTVYNIGYWDTLKPNGCKEYFIWKNMLSRCYNQNDKSYSRYGEKGVLVDERWHSFSNFYYDLRLLDGWNENKFYIGKLQLDKDKKQTNVSINNKIYSVNTCCLITLQENNKYQDYISIQKECVAINPNNEIITFINQNEFCKKYNLSIYTLWHILTNKDYSNNRWRFYYKEEWDMFTKEEKKMILDNKIHPKKQNKDKIFIAQSPNGEIYEDNNIRKFCDNHNLDHSSISRCLNNKYKQYKGWTFKYKS